MSCFRTGDPLDDFHARDMEQAEYEARLPRCEKCKEIIDDYYYEDDGEILCWDCFEKRHRKSAEDYANAYLD